MNIKKVFIILDRSIKHSEIKYLNKYFTTFIWSSKFKDYKLDELEYHDLFILQLKSKLLGPDITMIFYESNIKKIKMIYNICYCRSNNMISKDNIKKLQFDYQPRGIISKLDYIESKKDYLEYVLFTNRLPYTRGKIKQAFKKNTQLR